MYYMLLHQEIGIYGYKLGISILQVYILLLQYFLLRRGMIECMNLLSLRSSSSYFYHLQKKLLTVAFLLILSPIGFLLVF